MHPIRTIRNTFFRLCVASLGLFGGAPLAQASELEATSETISERAIEGLEAVQTGPKKLEVFGSQIFSGTFAASHVSAQDTYVIERGDRILIRLFGGKTVEAIETVDDRGNLFVPGVGPLPIAGRKLGALQFLVEDHVAQTYKESVKVYTALVSPGAIGVYVTGYVKRPGHYLGSPKDDLLFYLDQAGGIDPNRGNFRNVKVKRQNKDIETYDLYDFLLEGNLPKSRLRDGDVVFVGPQGPIVFVAGEVSSPFGFELDAQNPKGDVVLLLSRPNSTATNAVVQGTRGGLPSTSYHDLAEFSQVPLFDGDIITVRADTVGTMIAVAIDANISLPSLYVLPRGSTLSAFLDTISIEESLLDPSAIHLRRLSVAVEQKKAMSESLARLEREILTTGSRSAEEARVRSTEAGLISKFIVRAKEVEPLGIVSIMNDGDITDVRLEDGDIIVIPDRTDIVLVSGEVYSPGAFAVDSKKRVKSYIDRAGGFTASAFKKSVVVRKRNGTSERVSLNYRVEAGDQILILPRVEGKNFLLAKDISEIFFQIALTTATVLRL